MSGSPGVFVLFMPHKDKNWPGMLFSLLTRAHAGKKPNKPKKNPKGQSMTGSLARDYVTVPVARTEVLGKQDNHICGLLHEALGAEI